MPGSIPSPLRHFMLERVIRRIFKIPDEIEAPKAELNDFEKERGHKLVFVTHSAPLWALSGNTIHPAGDARNKWVKKVDTIWEGEIYYRIEE